MVRWLLAAGALAVLLGLAQAQASVSIAVTWDGLLRESTCAAVVTPIESRPVWEGGRIYTYTHVHIERTIAGELTTGGDAWVRTMGGVVAKVGQLVDGEPVLAPGQSSLLFLHAGPIGAFEVTARGQGQFPIVGADKTSQRVVRSTAAGALVAPRPTATSTTAPLQLAADVLHGRPIDDVARDVVAAWGRFHGR